MSDYCNDCGSYDLNCSHGRESNPTPPPPRAEVEMWGALGHPTMPKARIADFSYPQLPPQEDVKFKMLREIIDRLQSIEMKLDRMEKCDE